MVSLHGIVFWKAMQGKRINIGAFWVAAFSGGPPSTIDYSCFCKGFEKDSLYEKPLLVWAWTVPGGFPWGLRRSVTTWRPCGLIGGPGQPGRERLLGEGCWRACQRGYPGSCSHSAEIPQPSKKEGPGGRGKWFFCQRYVRISIRKRGESTSVFQSISQRQVCPIQVRNDRNWQPPHLLHPQLLPRSPWGADVSSSSLLTHEHRSKFFSGCSLIWYQLNKLHAVGRGTGGRRGCLGSWIYSKPVPSQKVCDRTEVRNHECGLGSQSLNSQ